MKELNYNILMVEDNPVDMQMIKKTLKDMGVQITAASSGEDALKELDDREYFVSILDINLPGISGFELAKIMKQNKNTCNTPMIFLTGDMLDEDHVFKGYESGAVDYLVKPTKASVLRSKILVFKQLFEQKHEIQSHRDHLEEEVRKRTKELETSQAKLQAQKAVLEQKNSALNEILNHFESQKQQVYRRINQNVNEVLLPLIEQFRRGRSEVEQEYLNILESSLKEITEPYMGQLQSKDFNFTPREVEICQMIKRGLSNKKMSQLLNITLQTVEAHRNKIRKKLGISKKKVNLTTYLRQSE